MTCSYRGSSSLNSSTSSTFQLCQSSIKIICLSQRKNLQQGFQIRLIRGKNKIDFAEFTAYYYRADSPGTLGKLVKEMASYFTRSEGEVAPRDKALLIIQDHQVSS